MKSAEALMEELQLCRWTAEEIGRLIGCRVEIVAHQARDDANRMGRPIIDVLRDWFARALAEVENAVVCDRCGAPVSPAAGICPRCGSLLGPAR